LSADTHRTNGGWWVIPHILPVWVPDRALTMSVAEWLDLREEP
jgi:hypothetical protein